MYTLKAMKYAAGRALQLISAAACILIIAMGVAASIGSTERCQNDRTGICKLALHLPTSSR